MKWARIYLFYSKFPQFLLSNGYYLNADKLVNCLELIFDYIVFLISFFLLEVCLSCINSISLSLCFVGSPMSLCLRTKMMTTRMTMMMTRMMMKLRVSSLWMLFVVVSMFPFFFLPCVYAFTSFPVKSMGIVSNYTLSFHKNVMKGEVRL